MNPLVQLLLGFMTVCVCNTTGKYCKNTLPGVSKVIQGVDLKSFDINKPGEGRLNPIIEMKCDQTRIRRYAGKDYQVPYEVKYINPISSGTFDESLFYIDKVENLAKMFSFEVTHKEHKFETLPKKSSKRKRAVDVAGALSMVNAAITGHKMIYDVGKDVGDVASHIIRRYGGKSDEIKPDLRTEGVIGSNSENFKHIQNSVQNNKKTYLYSKAQVKTMEVRLAPASELKFHPAFLKDLKELPRNLTKDTYEGRYLPFLKKYGTHYIERAILGGTAYLVHIVEKEFFEKSLTREDAQFFSKRDFDKTFDQHHNYEHPENYEENTSSHSMSLGKKEEIWTSHSEEKMFYVGGDPNLGKDSINFWQPTVRTSPELLSVELNPLYRLIKDDENQRFSLMVATEYSIMNKEPPDDLKQCVTIQISGYQRRKICCEKGEHLYNEKLCYRVFFDQFKTEKEALKACDQETSILMSPCDDAELNWVKRLLSWYYMNRAWLRAKRKDSFHKFMWERFEDDTVSYSVSGIWRRNDPFHKQPNENDKENCLYIDTLNLEGKISNTRCAMKMGFACVRPVNDKVTEQITKHTQFRKDSWGSNNGGCYGDCPDYTVTCTCDRTLLCG